MFSLVSGEGALIDPSERTAKHKAKARDRDRMEEAEAKRGWPAASLRFGLLHTLSLLLAIVDVRQSLAQFIHDLLKSSWRRRLRVGVDHVEQHLQHRQAIAALVGGTDDQGERRRANGIPDFDG